MNPGLRKGQSLTIELQLLIVVALLLGLATPSAHPSVTGWGDNLYGQTNAPGGSSLVGARSVAAGYWHNLAVGRTNNILVWGVNSYGQTNIPPGLNNVVAVAAGHDHSLALKPDGTVVGWGDNTYGQTAVPLDLTNAVAISAGGFHNAALRSDGTVTCWGYNFYGQSTVPPDLTNVAAIACGNSFTVALRSNGTVVAWGDDFYDQLLIPEDFTNIVSIAAGFAHGLALRADGTVSTWGDLSLGQGLPPASLANVTAVAAGFTHSLALKADGTVVSWGDNTSGETNVPPTLSRVIGIAGGFAHSVALTDDSPVITQQPVNVVTNVGGLGRFTVRATGSQPLSNRWYWVSASGTTNITAGNTTSTSGGVTTFTLSLNSVPTNYVGDYYAVITNLAGGVTSQVASLSLLVKPAITNQPLSVVTNVGATVAFIVAADGTEPLYYRWQMFNTNLPNVGSTNRLVLENVTLANQGNYRVIVTNAVGTAPSATATLTLSGKPAVVTQPSSQSVMQNDPVTFSVVADGETPMFYQWRFPTANPLPNATNSSYLIPSAQLSHAGNYTVVISNYLGAVTSSVAALTVLAPPVITQHPVNVATNVGGLPRFTVKTTGTTPIGARWWFNNGSSLTNFSAGNGSTTSGETTFTLNLPSATTNHAGNYWAVITNSVGAATSSVASLTLLYKPVITNQPLSVITNAGATVAFAVEADGSQPLYYRWQHFNTNLPTVGSTNLLVLENIAPGNEGNYRVIVTNSVGSVTSLVASLSIIGRPVIITQPQSQAITLNEPATLSVAAGGDGPLFYQWRLRVTNNIPNATNSTLEFSNVQTNDAGPYTVLITNHLGSITSSIANLTVVVPPEIILQPVNVVTNVGGSPRFIVQSTGSLPMTNRWWRFDGVTHTNFSAGTRTTSGGINTFTLTLTNVSSNAIGGYYLVISNSANVVTSSLASLTIAVKPTITSQPQNIATNIGATAAFGVEAAGTAPLYYRWQYNGTNLPGVDSTNQLLFASVGTNLVGNYRVIITNMVGAITSQVATLTIVDPSFTPAQLFAANNPGRSGFYLTIAFEAGKNYRIQMSTNLQNWVDLTNFLSTSTSMEFLDATATNDPQRFYRVISP